MKSWAAVLTLAALYAAAAAIDAPECVTDACVFAMCEQEKGRPCTDDDVFGPAVESDCADLPPDHPDHCEEETT